MVPPTPEQMAMEALVELLDETDPHVCVAAARAILEYANKQKLIQQLAEDLAQQRIEADFWRDQELRGDNDGDEWKDK